MSIANLLEPNNYDLFTHSLDTTTQSLLLGVLDAPRIDIGGGLTPVFINGIPYNSGGTPVIPQRLAYFTGNTSSTIDDCNITVTGANNDLTFDQNTTIFVDNVNAVGGDTLNIGLSTQDIIMDASNSIVIGHEGLAVQIAEGTITNYVRTSNVDRNGTPDPLNIGGTFASPLNLGRSGQNVNVLGTLITDSIDSVNPTSLFINSPFITMGGIGGNVMVNNSISFLASGPPSINYFNSDKQFAVNGVGPFATQPICNYGISRLNDMVTLNIKWSGPPILVTANSDLTLSPALALAFRPMIPQGFACSVRIAGLLYTLGQVTIDVAGVVTIVPSATSTWNIGMMADFGAICCSYDIQI